MKKICLFFILTICLYGKLFCAGVPVVEQPINSYGTPVTVAISSTTLTMVPTSQTSGRFGIFVSNPSSNAAAIEGFLGNCTSTALASTIRPISISTNPANNSQYISMREDVCLWLLSLNTAASSANIHYQEVKQ